MVTRVPRQPGPHLVDLVGSVVVHYHVDLKPAGQIRVDFVEELEELLMPVASIAAADRHAASVLSEKYVA
jgi:hypothetical protein